MARLNARADIVIGEEQIMSLPGKVCLRRAEAHATTFWFRYFHGMSYYMYIM